MIKNYFKTAWRNIKKNKLFSVINIVGLGIGIATCFIIMLYVQDELSYDKFNINADRIARVIFKANINSGEINESVTMPPVAKTMKNNFPEVEDATRLLQQGKPKVTYNNKIFKDDELVLVDPNFFSIFTLPMLQGDYKTALQKPNTLVITQNLAEKYFGKESPLGRTLSFNNNTSFYTVTGVIKDIPSNSHFHFEMFGSMAGWQEASLDTWMSGGYHTYLLLKPGADLKKIEVKFPAMVEKYMGPQIQQQMGLSIEQFRTKGNSMGFTLQPLTDIHLHSNTNNEYEPGGNATYVYIFAGVAIFMLIVACINFINLSTAGASKRAKEVGIRKVSGCTKKQLIGQFLLESVLITIFALFVAFTLVKLGMPAFNNIAGKNLTFNFQPFIAFIFCGLLVGVLAGIYPAFYLSSYKPVAVLKGKLNNNNSGFGLRSGLVVFQFFISVSLIIGTIVVYQQMKYIQNKDLGFDKEQLIIIPNSYALGNNEQTFKQEMLHDPRIVNATVSSYKPAGPSNYNNSLVFPQGNDNLLVNGVGYRVDENYIPTFGINIVNGRNFSKDYISDSSAILLNETAAQMLGWNNTTVVGKTVLMQNSDRGDNYPYRVIGVVKNFNFKTLHKAISPLFMTLKPESGLIFKIKTTDLRGLLSTMNKLWNSFQTGEPFAYNFIDDLFANTYSAEQKTGTILNLFAILTIFVASLGLFGLATYTAEQRTKEIGVRKVLGASVAQITQMLSKQFVKLVCAASLAAFPVAWWGMNTWLQSFAYRIHISWWIFAAAGIAALMVALLTVSFQAIKAATRNPIKSLRTE
ncbi:ABC transporter permease [Haoranjiania flava]|uniref:ABC transporter permease n=1 Tax=Haoranjiania flava TaxID=1856322 RepID=A0AAE3IML1_9BACT|nr:ABC transporter permease [Haoranjiania flava]MCU7694822.1 ABC transporter permease [Haoranjiania flava]